jgi:4-hydroxy-3-methylbut-2-enyl diphosphate reductase
MPPENSTVIIRAHGVSPQVERNYASLGLNILDATCPHVKSSQGKAAKFAKNGFRVFLAGEKNHGELGGIRGYVEDNFSVAKHSCVSVHNAMDSCFVVGNYLEAAAAAAELYRIKPTVKTALIGQTTISRDEFGIIGEGIKKFFPDLEIVDTICGATSDRQEALQELCEKVDAVVVAGSGESANTRRLFSLAVNLGKPAWLVEKSCCLPSEIFKYKTVGLSAGASTPDELIMEIEAALKTH